MDEKDDNQEALQIADLTPEERRSLTPEYKQAMRDYFRGKELTGDILSQFYEWQSVRDRAIFKLRIQGKMEKPL